MFCDVMELGTEPSGLHQQRKALDGKPGARTVVLPSAVWATDPPAQLTLMGNG